MTQIPQTQKAVQLTGPDELTFNPNKEVYTPGPWQILCKVEVVGLCFSDLKLLKQFNAHARKSEILSGIDLSVLDEYPAYKVDSEPTVPGHEIVVRVVAQGDKVTHTSVGGRYLVQADHRWLHTKASNGAIGYNIEGGLQEYMLIDQRVSTSPEGEFMLIEVTDERSASAVALVEPWACVEDAYVVEERQTLTAGGNMLVCAEADVDTAAFNAFIGGYGKPASITIVGNDISAAVDGDARIAADIESLDDEAFDDVVYFGSNAETLEKLFIKVAAHGLINIVLCGGKFETEPQTAVGRVHYGGIRIIGTTGSDPAESMKTIPATGEIRKGDVIDVVGAGGPMGVMHVVRNICQGVEDVTVYAGDLDDERLAALSKFAKPMAEERNVGFFTYNPKTGQGPKGVDYSSLMAPVPALAAACVKNGGPKSIINIFAGIPATVYGPIDLNHYIENGMYFIGTSGSTLDDMKKVLAKVLSGQLDTNISVAAVSGLEASVEGIRAVENHAIPGKILVYPDCEGLGLTELSVLAEKHPSVVEALDNGVWTKAAEMKLLKEYE